MAPDWNAISEPLRSDEDLMKTVARATAIKPRVAAERSAEDIQS